MAGKASFDAHNSLPGKASVLAHAQIRATRHKLFGVHRKSIPWRGDPAPCSVVSWGFLPLCQPAYSGRWTVSWCRTLRGRIPAVWGARVLHGHGRGEMFVLRCLDFISKLPGRQAGWILAGTGMIADELHGAATPAQTSDALSEGTPALRRMIWAFVARRHSKQARKSTKPSRFSPRHRHRHIHTHQ